MEHQKLLIRWRRINAIGHPISTGDGFEELDSRSCFLIGYQDCFDPLGELVDDD
jgi:hypothetical protein